ncbi:hypothetical protein B0H14DRAFT_2781660 [Mycena olivaceomarginata]|nr:hypothetical protein B0H14DRAFT_2781660 [Mycena olivaceomarginata]
MGRTFGCERMILSASVILVKLTHYSIGSFMTPTPGRRRLYRVNPHRRRAGTALLIWMTANPLFGAKYSAIGLPRLWH